jgi:outer membrane protein assembly factor BamB
MWSETNNIKWKVEVPGSGTSTPIVWRENVFLLIAVPSTGATDTKPAQTSYQWQILCLDRGTGKTLWQKTAIEQIPHEGHHPDHGFASASPVTDGERVIAYFGSRGLHCYNMKGEKLWERQFGKMQTRNSFGEASSPAMHGNTVAIYWDDETDNDFVMALDKSTGRELWKKARNEPTGWSTPLIVENAGKPQVIINATGKVRAYDLVTGDELWSCAGQTTNAIPTPVADADTVYITSGFRGSALYAIARGRTGDLTATDAVRWRRNKNTPYVPSPLLAGDRIYTITGNNGVLSCFDTRTGAPDFEGAKLDGLSGVYASPVAAAGRVYVLGRDGTCLVLKQGPTLEVLATNKLDGKTDASMALVGKQLFIRSHRHLYCIENPAG